VVWVSYGGKTVPRWRTATISKNDISPLFSEKLSNFHEILYTAADFELDERHVIKNEKVALNRLRVRHNVFLPYYLVSAALKVKARAIIIDRQAIAWHHHNCIFLRHDENVMMWKLYSSVKNVKFASLLYLLQTIIISDVRTCIIVHFTSSASWWPAAARDWGGRECREAGGRRSTFLSIKTILLLLLLLGHLPLGLSPSWRFPFPPRTFFRVLKRKFEKRH